MMSRRACVEARKKCISTSTRGAVFHPPCDRSTSNTRMLSRASAISVSTAAICWATVSSRSSRGVGATEGDAEGSGGGVEESISIPLVEQRDDAARQRGAFTCGQRATVRQSAQRGELRAAERDHLAVHVERGVIVKNLRRAVESQALPRNPGGKRRHPKRCRRDEPHGRLRLREKSTEKPPHAPILPADPREGRGRLVPHHAVD